MHSDNLSPKSKERYLDYLRLREEGREVQKSLGSNAADTAGRTSKHRAQGPVARSE